MVYSSTRKEGRLVVERPANGTGPETIRANAPFGQILPTGVSPDNRWLVVRQSNINMTLVSREDGLSVPFLQGRTLGGGYISPDGRWLLYSSIPASRSEIFAQRVPKDAGGSANAEGIFQISTAGGSAPAWRGDGKEIFYLALDGKMMAVPVESSDTFFRPGTPRPLFETHLTAFGSFRDYDVSADGQKFVINEPTADTSETPITVIVNWPKLLAK
jgi:hypothetical protein